MRCPRSSTSRSTTRRPTATTPADDAIVSQRALHEIYLPAFWAATQQAKASSVMCAYSTINGQYACQNQYLMRTRSISVGDFPGS